MITIEAFRSDQERVEQWRQVLALPVVQEVLEMLDRVAPINFNVDRGLSAIDANIILGDERGYARYGRLFRQFGEKWPMKPKDQKPSYGAPKE